MGLLDMVFFLNTGSVVVRSSQSLFVPPNTGSVAVHSSQGRCFFFLRVLAQQMSYVVISGPIVLKHVDIWSDFVNFI